MKKKKEIITQDNPLFYELNEIKTNSDYFDWYIEDYKIGLWVAGSKGISLEIHINKESYLEVYLDSDYNILEFILKKDLGYKQFLINIDEFIFPKTYKHKFSKLEFILDSFIPHDFEGEDGFNKTSLGIVFNHIPLSKYKKPEPEPEDLNSVMASIIKNLRFISIPAAALLSNSIIKEIDYQNKKISFFFDNNGFVELLIKSKYKRINQGICNHYKEYDWECILESPETILKKQINNIFLK